MRRDFVLPESDTIFLDATGLIWETIIDQNMLWVLVQDFPVPLGYNCQKINVAVKIETGYPRTQLDMAYFFPALSRLDGNSINATCFQQIDGKQYQRWSRHRTPQNPWREGVDDLSTHFALISFWFEQEFIKKANGIAA